MREALRGLPLIAEYVRGVRSGQRHQLAGGGVHQPLVGTSGVTLDPRAVDAERDDIERIVGRPKGTAIVRERPPQAGRIPAGVEGFEGRELLGMRGPGRAQALFLGVVPGDRRPAGPAVQPAVVSDLNLDDRRMLGGGLGAILGLELRD